jgi:hypothetical protein
MTKKIAILQSNYIPWKGYFDLINMVDEFILYDDVQYTKRDWRNRNRIKTPTNSMWLTIPVRQNNPQKIKDTVVSYPNWNREHWKTIVQNYSQARYFSTFKDLFEKLYLDSSEQFLSQINYRFISTICEILGIITKLSWSTEYQLTEGRTERLVDLCKQARATEYISGPAAQAYLNEETFKREGISVRYIDYSGYPEYAQLYPPFDHKVSILDLFFNTGPKASTYMKSFGSTKS